MGRVEPENLKKKMNAIWQNEKYSTNIVACDVDT
jgi:hypothetical protein